MTLMMIIITSNWGTDPFGVMISFFCNVYQTFAILAYWHKRISLLTHAFSLLISIFHLMYGHMHTEMRNCVRAAHIKSKIQFCLSF